MTTLKTHIADLNQRPSIPNELIINIVKYRLVEDFIALIDFTQAERKAFETSITNLVKIKSSAEISIMNLAKTSSLLFICIAARLEEFYQETLATCREHCRTSRRLTRNPNAGRHEPKYRPLPLDAYTPDIQKWIHTSELDYRMAAGLRIVRRRLRKMDKISMRIGGQGESELLGMAQSPRESLTEVQLWSMH